MHLVYYIEQSITFRKVDTQPSVLRTISQLIVLLSLIDFRDFESTFSKDCVQKFASARWMMDSLYEDEREFSAVAVNATLDKISLLISSTRG